MDACPVGPATHPSSRRRTGAPFRLSGRATIILLAVLAIVAGLRHRPDRAGDLRPPGAAPDLAGRAAPGIVTFLLLTFQVCLGLVLSHPTNKSTWKLSKRIFPWHEHLWVFVVAFLLVHIVSIVLDPYAKVRLVGALIPGLSEYRSAAVALGTMALYAFLVTAMTARYTKLLPPGVWL